MSATFSERLQAEFAASRDRLPIDVLPLDQRHDALQALAGLGLPGLRDDAWRYANWRPLQTARLQPGERLESPADVAAVLARLATPAEGTLRLVFVGGRLDASSSSTDGAVLIPLPAPAFASRRGEQRFALLNDIFATDAARFRVARDCAVEIVFIASATSYPRVELEFAAGVHATVVERHVAGTGPEEALLVSAVTAFDLERDVQLRHARLQDLPADATHVESLQVRVQSGARFESVQLQLGGGAVRSTIGCELLGRGSSAEVDVASLADGNRTLDTTLKIDHLAEDTQSRQELRAVAADRSHVAFQSYVTMDSRARGADSRQSLKGLIGGAGAEVNLRPQLEIDVDSVRASHGATTGAIDEAMLFYLLSRGLDRETARQLLEWAFIETVIGRVSQPALRREFEERIVARLGNRAALEALA
ncbi:MAG: SufD family Fe-S cluster assembly protein [Steroidobacteraceae bacterium]